MKKILRNLLFLAGLGIPGVGLATPIISIDPTVSFGSIGDTITVDILWDGSADPEYLGAWDVDIAFDPTILSFSGAVFGFGVDSLGCFPGITCDALLLGPGLLDIFELSLDDAATLMANQDVLGNMFLLASISFDAIANGTSSLAFIGQSLAFGDELGNRIFPILNGARVCIGPNGCIDVPEPTGIALFVSGLLLFGLRRRLAN
ncbi:cohesin domain-containing protein [Aliiglaciecola sp. CAU 1673]|uniref:cohesin domain-containing protein n=1 Tax=Aliiglaciecola sp. CAU 1673 TaxID=3032595 RepID=UPI0023DA1FCC|nr:cohesin domain-containing protein [Aliiglaciecola sp. CAU 1673]MDF2177047.1 cohesin domain-containing protein [Aliiglaciecola sp. CAU 1673]